MNAANVSDKTVLITGSTDGVGKLVALDLARAGARVLLHGRSAEKGEAVLDEIRAATGSRKLEYYCADLSSLNEVRRLAQEVERNHDRLDILINNAGIGSGARGGAREVSRDGQELRFAVNYLAPFLLTHLLLPTLRRSAPARIVNVASLGQFPVDFEDVMLEREYDGARAYRQSKLAEIMFTISLAEQLEGTGITVNSLHPATFMNTKMVVESGVEPTSRVEEGAEAIVYVTTSPELAATSGEFFNGKRPARANPAAYDREARQRLWDLSMRLTGPVPQGGEGPTKWASARTGPLRP